MKKKSDKKIKLNKKQLNELFSKLQKTQIEIPEKENLEKEIVKETKEIQTEQFQEFMHSTGKLITPILESNPRQNIPPEQEIPTTPATENRETGIRNYDIRNTNDYNIRQIENLEKRYESRIEAPVLTPRENTMRQAHFVNPMEQMNLSEKETINSRFIGAEFLEHERNLPFEREERKYKKTRL
ncbi:MAG: hypothetical protein WC584_00615 [Candidatus Pacearchaeota archaeon]